VVIKGRMEMVNGKASILVLVAVIASLAGCSSVGTTMLVTPGHELQPLNVCGSATSTSTGSIESGGVRRS